MNIRSLTMRRLAALSNHRPRLARTLLSVIALAVSLAVQIRVANAQSPAISEAPKNIEETANLIAGAYKELPLNSGVFTASEFAGPGQAALWDLNIIDHYHYFGPAARARGYRPEQPIAFSHVTHVQKNQMECQYCHWSVTKASYAAIPEEQTCMGCHALVKGRSDFQKAEIAKLEKFYAEGQPIPWVKVHVTPAFVAFNHKRHVKAGVNCQECHGQVPNMPVVERVSSMKMGWCVECHRQQGTSIDCWTCHK